MGKVVAYYQKTDRWKVSYADGSTVWVGRADMQNTMAVFPPTTFPRHCDLHALSLELNTFELAFGKKGTMADMSVLQHGYKLAYLLKDKWDFYKFHLPECVSYQLAIQTPSSSLTSLAMCQVQRW
jgi:hypothetical protein